MNTVDKEYGSYRIVFSLQRTNLEPRKRIRNQRKKKKKRRRKEMKRRMRKKKRRKMERKR